MLHNETLAHIGHYRIKPPHRRSGLAVRDALLRVDGCFEGRGYGVEGLQVCLGGADDAYAANWLFQTPSAGCLMQKRLAWITLKPVLYV